MTDRIGLAAHNNALWVDTVCRSHGVQARLDEAMWSSPTRTPPYYPDAVTLSPSVGEYDVLARVDGSEGCSVKDSFGSLDLTVEDFARLVDGQWVWHDSPGRPGGDGRRWQHVTTPEAMRAWAAGWANDPDDAGILTTSLLDEAGVYVLGAKGPGEDASFVAGAVVNVTEAAAGSVAGVSNLFARDDDPARAWLGAVAAARDAVGGIPLVGWEAGDGLDAATAAGWEPVGPLTVWIS